MIQSLACLLLTGLAGDLEASAPVANRTESTVRVELRWHNGWRNDRNHDAIWIVLRDPADPNGPTLRLDLDSHRVTGTPKARVVVPADGVGAFVEPRVEHRGDIEWTLDLRLADEIALPERIDAWAVEMVYVPGGAFEIGDDAPGVVEKGALRAKDGGPFELTSEATLAIGSAEGAVHYDAGSTPQYIGDGSGPVPAGFPKGTRPFYVMKYELRQGEYARFLNALPSEWRAARAPLELQGEETETCSIKLRGTSFVAAAASRPCNFVTWSDTAAWTDWMGLRPMTELEFEKAARGPRRPVPADFPWGTSSRTEVARLVLPTRDLAAATRRDEARLNDATRVRLAASYYWVHDLSGSLWERVVTIGHPRGRAFKGTHGDGRLVDGLATNADWPHQEGREAPGIGYRGGADYFGGEPNETNPFSCVGTRQYGAWAGAYRYKTYSARAARSAATAGSESER